MNEVYSTHKKGILRFNNPFKYYFLTFFTVMLETENDGDIEMDVATEVEDVEEDNTTSDDEISYEQAMKWKKDSESLQKANKKIASMEKIKKSPETVSSDLSEDALDALLEKRDFYKTNSQAKDLRNEIEAMITASNGRVDRQKAFDMLSWDAEIEENRKVYSKSAIEGNKTNSVWFSPISIDKYDKLSSAEQNSYNEKSKAKNGGVVFK